MFVPVNIQVQMNKEGMSACMQHEHLPLKMMDTCIFFDDWQLYTWRLHHRRQSTSTDL